MRCLFFFGFLLCSAVAFGQGKTPTQTKPATTPTPADPESFYPVNLDDLELKLPETADPELKKILGNPKTIFYKLPQVWQHYIPSSKIEWSNLTLGTKSYFNTDAVWGVYYSSFNGDFNANPLFPWETTIGLNSVHKDGDTKYRTINFISLPEDSYGDVTPILLLNEAPIKWIFPSGTTVGEVIYVIHSDKKYIQEIRTRRKSANSTEWEPKLYRPVTSKAEFIALIGKDYTPAHKYFFFRNPQEDEVFKMEGLVERLPPLSEQKVKTLLARPFKEVGEDFWSPAADQDFHILPRNYCFSLLSSIDAVTCANCHRQTQISVRNLTPKEPLVINNFEKVGNIRGSDAVFTWHPFSNKSVRKNSEEPEPKISLRPYDTTNKIVKVFEKDEYSSGEYKLTLFVQESLKPYELPAVKFLHKVSAPVKK